MALEPEFQKGYTTHFVLLWAGVAFALYHYGFLAWMVQPIAHLAGRR